MKCQILFSGKNKKNISKCHLLKILPRVLSVNKLHVNELVEKDQISSLFSLCTPTTDDLYMIGTEN